jgi:flavin reductase (DIM6/NTAB) family NADH-FMN oxidoreductase RutF
MTTGESRHDIDLALLRRVMGSFASGVTVVLADVGGQIKGMTANAFLSGSLEPPLCVVSVAKRAHMHAHLTAAGRFSVNILAASQETVALRFAGRTPEDSPPVFQQHDGVPLLSGTAAQLSADVTAAHDCGDHTLFVGRISWVGANDRMPLLYHAGRFASLVPREDTGPLLEFW